MPHYTADTMTAGPAPAIHAGVNTQISKYTLAAKVANSTTFALTPLPAGSEVIDVKVLLSNNGYGAGASGGEAISVWANIGGITAPAAAPYQFMLTASAANATYIDANNGRGFGQRITASANLFMSLDNATSTGSAALDITVITQYLTRKRGD